MNTVFEKIDVKIRIFNTRLMGTHLNQGSYFNIVKETSYVIEKKNLFSGR